MAKRQRAGRAPRFGLGSLLAATLLTATLLTATLLTAGLLTAGLLAAAATPLAGAATPPATRATPPARAVTPLAGAAILPAPTMAVPLATSALAVPLPTSALAVPQPPLPVAVTIDRLDPGPMVPREFLGLSFEAAALTQISKYAARGDLVTLLRSLGPGVIRFGGITADQNVAWTDSATPRPAWASRTIGPAQMHALGVLARRSGWRVLLTVTMAHFEPAAAAREIATAHRYLGHNLAAVEIGNEPDAYGRHGFRPLPWIAQGYEEEVGEYRSAIGALTPDVPIAGPDVSGSGIFSEWGEEEALSQRPALLTGHHYPLGCAQKPPPSIEALLSVLTRGRESASLRTYMRVARNQHVPLRIDEAGSVSCGGVDGISDTFASALWASGYITQVMAAGAAGINLQGNPGNCAGYTPLCAPDPAALAGGALRAQPEWYALLLAKSLVGYRPLPTTVTAQAPSTPAQTPPNPAQTPTSAQTGGAVLTPAAERAGEEKAREERSNDEKAGEERPTATRTPPTLALSGLSETLPGMPEEAPPPTEPPAGPNLVVSSFTGPHHGVQVVLVDDEPPGAPALALRLNVGAGLGAGEVLRLTGPRPSATADVLLGGHAVNAAGVLRAPILPERVAAHKGVVAVTLAPSSAALLTVGPRSTARARARRRLRPRATS